MRSPQHRGPFAACVALTVGCGAFLGHALTTPGIMDSVTDSEPFSAAHMRVADAIRLDPDTSGSHAATAPAAFRAPASVVVVPATSDLAVSPLVGTTGRGHRSGDRPGTPGDAHDNGGSNGSAPVGPGSSNGSGSSTGHGNADRRGGSDQRDSVTAPSGSGSSAGLTVGGGKTPPGQTRGLPTVSAAISHGQVSVTVEARRVAGPAAGSTTDTSSTTTGNGDTRSGHGWGRQGTPSGLDRVRPAQHVTTVPGKHSAKLVTHEAKHQAEHGTKQAPGKHRAEKPGKHRR